MEDTLEIFVIEENQKRLAQAEIKPLASSDLGSCVSCQEEVVSTTPSELFVSSTESEIQAYIESGSAIGVFVEGKLCAYGLLELDLTKDHSLKDRLPGLGEALPIQQIAALDTIAVLPSCRGNKLQIAIANHLLKLAWSQGKKAAYTTVSPKNTPSVNNLLALGFEIVTVTLLYGGKERYIMRQLLGIS
jgi:ribosomal protein S18 acetylase RimI-like enzyme